MKSVPRNRYVAFALLASAGFAWDLYSKHVVFADLGYVAGRLQQPGQHKFFAQPGRNEGQTVPYIDGWLTFRLYTSFNRGALWGVGQGWSGFFALLSVAAVVGILWWLFIHGSARSKWLTVALGFITAGTLGNLWDRMAWHGYVDDGGQPVQAVRDFLLFTFGGWAWPVFNFADVFLVTGAIMLVVQSLFGIGEERESKIEDGR